MQRSIRSGVLTSLTLGLLVASCTSTVNPQPGTATTRPGQRASAGSRTFDPAVLARQGIHVERNGDIAIYRGRLTADGLNTLRSAGADPRIRTLLIDSTGGEFGVSMDFGNWVIDRELDVVVDHACLASCANYVFPAGRNKEILPGAVVAWHGSAKQSGLLDQLDRSAEAAIAARRLPPGERQEAVKRARRANAEYLTAAIRKQDEFFYRIGVDEYVTRVGNDRYGVRGFFYLSVADMAAFGIENVTAADNYEAMDPEALAQRVGFPVTLVRLE